MKVLLSIIVILAASSLSAVDGALEPDCSLVDCLDLVCAPGQIEVTPPGSCCQVCQCPIKGQTVQLCQPCPSTCSDIINGERRSCPAICQRPGGCGCPGERPIIDTLNGVCVAQEDCPNPCEGFECPSHASCKVHPPSGEAFCDPSCSVNNGGCLVNQQCQLLPTRCPGPEFPCPPRVVCSHVGPCTACTSNQACILETKQTIQCLDPPCPKCLDRRCGLPADPGPCEAAIRRYFFNVETGDCEEFTYGGCNGNENNFESLQECRTACDVSVSSCAATLCPVGSRCVEENGQGFCVPDCSIDNGGCRPDQICKIEVVQCVRAPCLPSQRICEASCPPACSREFCSNAGPGRLCSDPGPRELPGCTGPCQLSYCGLCYVNDEPISPTPGNCRTCRDPDNYASNTSCYRRWRRCTTRAHRRLFGPVDFSARGEFMCYRPPCPRRG